METQVKRLERHHEQAVAVLKHYFENRIFTGVEVGTNAGDLTKTLLRDLPNLARLITMDPWKHFPGEQFEAGNEQTYHNEQRQAAYQKLQEYAKRVKIFEKTSDEVFEEMIKLGVKADFVWIDGHHAEAQVRKDIENGLKVLKRPGIIGGHDYGLVDDVKRVVDSILGSANVHTGGDFTWWVLV